MEKRRRGETTEERGEDFEHAPQVEQRVVFGSVVRPTLEGSPVRTLV